MALPSKAETNKGLLADKNLNRPLYAYIIKLDDGYALDCGTHQLSFGQDVIEKAPLDTYDAEHQYNSIATGIAVNCGASYMAATDGVINISFNKLEPAINIINQVCRSAEYDLF